MTSEHRNHTVNNQPNIKYVSAAGHFGAIYNTNHELQTIDNNWEDMRTYNYYSPITKPMMHFYFNYLPYKEYNNVPAVQRR